VPAVRAAPQNRLDFMLYMQHNVGVRQSKRQLEGEDVIAEINSGCVLMRARLISRVLTAIYDEALRPFGVGSPQFVLLAIIFGIQPATRAEIGRHHHQDRSTLTRNLKILLSERWVEEVEDDGSGRGRPIVLTKAGRDLLVRGAPTWRAAQAQAKTILGEHGMTAITDIANGIMNSPA
jgi:DNA-binding MarR family transcriptional regulator